MNTVRLLLRTQHVGWIPLFIKTPVMPSCLHATFLQPSSPRLCIGQEPRWIHCGSAVYKDKPNSAEAELLKIVENETKDKSLVTHDDYAFEQAAKDAKNKANFNRVVEVFKKKDIRRRGHVEFIYAALKKMPEFGVQRDITVYNKLLDVFPKEVFVPINFIQRMFNHYPKQQECGVQVLEQMESHGVMPNKETKSLLLQIFGQKSHPMRKYQRMMYWFPKFKHANPLPVPHELPQDPVDLARFSLPRIANDLDARITVYQHPSTDITETGEEITQPYILGIQSPDQSSLLARHNPDKPVFVEGPFPLWLRKTCVHYYLLRADPIPPEEMELEIDLELVSPQQSLFFPHYIDFEFTTDLGDDDTFDVDDVVDDPVYAMCMVGQNDQATLARWISGLQETNPILGRIPTVFRLESGPREIQAAADLQHSSEQNTQSETEQEHNTEEDQQYSQRMKQ
ncbi:evolutionarily conserved signaling intermediate in Toll pathway, mitochondrial [Salminus brasiliensis]|uniref:evolutionarily conserved signaling intermediate in Toll pathway, mitochondrial n=1 Tax=Salminus brasiliensis TaxID=930266 RepID=UPI003B8341B1